jgi:hypothetical protein
VPEVDNLLAALDWSRQQGDDDLIARLASRMIGYWRTYVRLAEMAEWRDVLLAALPTLSPALRARALLPAADHAMMAGEFEEMERRSAEALSWAAPASWEAAWALSVQALYWIYADPDRGRQCIAEGRRAAVEAGVPEIERSTALHASGLLWSEWDRDAALHLVGELEGMSADDFTINWVTAGLLVLAGEPERAAALGATPVPRSPFERYYRLFRDVLVASATGRADEARQHLDSLVLLVREHAIPLGEPACLIGFALLALDRGDYARASRLLATVGAGGFFPFRSHNESLLYRRCVAAASAGLDPDTRRRCRDEGADLTVTEALNNELARR